MFLVWSYWIVLGILCVKAIGNVLLPYRVLKSKNDEGVSIGFLLLGDVVLLILVVLLSWAVDRPGLMYRVQSALLVAGGAIIGTYVHYFGVLFTADCITRRKRSKEANPDRHA